MKNILVIRFSSIGDIVLCSPVVRHLKQNGHKVTMITKAGFKGLWKNNPYVDELILADDISKYILDELKSKSFDIIIDLHNNSRSNRIKQSLSVKTYTLKKSNVNKALLVWFKSKVFSSPHIVDRYLETIDPLIDRKDSLGLEFFEDLPTDKISNIISQKYAVYVIGGQHKGKMMSLNGMIDLCKDVKYPLYLLGGPEDKIIGEEVERLGSDQIINLAGKLSLMDSVNLIKQSTFVISHDTGLMHIASAYKKNIISLWGATTPELGFAPYKPGKSSVVLEAKHWLRPTSKLGKQRFSKHLNFIDRIPKSEILKEMDRLWVL